MRKKLLVRNTFSSIIFQIATIVCNFILPRLILSHYGSETNGLINSITQFLSFISFLDLGVGAVVQSALYKPLATKDYITISQIMQSAHKFFRLLARILLVYIFVLCLIFPHLVTSSNSHLFDATLILVMSISTFAQYYFGIIDRILLTADQRGYIQFNAQTITLLLNTIFCSILILLGFGIHAVKLTTSLVFAARPLFLRWYVNKHYKINRNIKYSGEPIKQKWNGIAQHVAAVVLDNTDVVVLSLMSTLQNVSIYSVYHLVAYGVKKLFLSLMNGVQSIFGELWAKNEIDNLKKIFSQVEWTVHTSVTLVFGITASLIVPFVAVYTRGINDADYYVPLFGLLITLANAGHCLRLPYNIMILAANHYKQTQNNYIIAAIGNIVISVLTVRHWGLVGVAIGTLFAMIYQTIWMAVYNSRNLVKNPFRMFVKQLIVDIFVFVVAYLICRRMTIDVYNYYEWALLAIKISTIWILVSLVINFVFFKRKMMYFVTYLNRK